MFTQDIVKQKEIHLMTIEKEMKTIERVELSVCATH